MRGVFVVVCAMPTPDDSRAEVQSHSQLAAPSNSARQLHLGLTGNIASGKSTVARMLVEHGAAVIDADVLARTAVLPGTAALEDIRERFGESVMASDGTLNREALRRIVFHDPVARDALNQIVHPAVRLLREKALVEARERGDRIVVSDIPLLFETGLEHSVDAVVFVDAPDEERLRRLLDTRGLSESDARAMMQAQWPAAEKRKRSQFVIRNDGTVEQLANRVSDLWNQLLAFAQAR